MLHPNNLIGRRFCGRRLRPHQVRTLVGSVAAALGLLAFMLTIAAVHQTAFREHCVGTLRHTDTTSSLAGLEFAVMLCAPSARTVNELCLVDAVSAGGDVAAVEWLVATFGLTDRGVTVHGCEPTLHAATLGRLNVTAWLATRFLDCSRVHCVESPRVQRAMLAYCRRDDVAGARWFADYYNINLARSHHWADHSKLLSACAQAAGPMVRQWLAAQFNGEV